jgi:hypothetical protein
MLLNDDSPEREITMKKLSEVNQVMLDDIAALYG